MSKPENPSFFPTFTIAGFVTKVTFGKLNNPGANC